jgi:hypothetical protein
MDLIVGGHDKLSQKWSFQIEPLGKLAMGDLQTIPHGELPE